MNHVLHNELQEFKIKSSKVEKNKDVKDNADIQINGHAVQETFCNHLFNLETKTKCQSVEAEGIEDLNEVLLKQSEKTLDIFQSQSSSFQNCNKFINHEKGIILGVKTSNKPEERDFKTVQSVIIEKCVFCLQKESIESENTTGESKNFELKLKKLYSKIRKSSKATNECTCYGEQSANVRSYQEEKVEVENHQQNDNIPIFHPSM